ncbi:hypothetical protein [Aridibaculum aurantiacum]|uniref:hypothetical protein n=1 Tax=Aridibaculum aurantiacum TaxID=2810307 RepID=UPI001A976C45|nr:hypothetical protein [Aridibaculum aurantiacum]
MIANGVGEREDNEVFTLLKKPFYPIGDSLRTYLKTYGREVRLPVTYNDLNRMNYSVPIKDKNGNFTDWEQVLYEIRDWEYLREGLVNIYSILKTKGDPTYTKNLDVQSIDYCPFGNSNPFRIKIINKTNNNYDHFYVKKADASRIYGLELEHLLSPNRLTYFTSQGTLIEEHIPGIPGDIFINKYLDQPETNLVRLAKEFVKFNERCFVRLLGDMRSYNFVVNVIPDVEDVQYRFRAIDFDQQSYEARKNLYRPQFFKENLPFVQTVVSALTKESVEQYQMEERTLMASRLTIIRYRLLDLLNIMSADEISSDEKLSQLKNELADHLKSARHLHCKSMGELVKANLKHLLQKNLALVQEVKRMYA